MAHRIGIFGGSFDPPHIGHFITARAAAERLGLEQVLVIPTATQPHKPNGAEAPAELRWEMVCAAIGDDELFKPSRIELDRDGISYSVDTVMQLTEIYQRPEYELYYLVGFDSLMDIGTWRNPEDIFRLVQIVALMRSEVESAELSSKWALRATILPTPRIDVSSTEIRKRVSEGLSVRWLVGENVENIIKEHNLYN